MSQETINMTPLSSLIGEKPQDTYSKSKLSENDEDELLEIFFDGNESIENRIASIEELSKKNTEICAESVNKITSMFSFSPNYIFRNLIKEIALTSGLDLNMKTECARTLYDENKELGYECFNRISLIMSELPIPLQVDIVRTLMETMKFYTDTCSKFVSIVTNKKLECEYRYKTIIGIQKDSSRKYKSQYLNDGYISFFKHVDTFIRYKILSAQYLLQLSKKGGTVFGTGDINTVVDEVEKDCISFATDTTLDYDLRADAADLLVRLGTLKSKETGKEIITLLGRNPDGVSTLYNNRQNVHDDVIDESIRKFILYLASLRSEVNTEGNHVTFADAQREIQELAKNHKPTPDNFNEKKKSVMDCVKSSLLRISLDQTIYDGGQTLQSIFNKIWRLILSHEHCDLLKTRMIEELVDMADTCSSGHISRVVNVLCGFEVDGKTFSIEIGWKKQIQSNLIARLTKRIKDHPEEEKRDTILEEMCTSGDITKKPELATFFRNNLLPIRDELFDEFVGGKYVTEDDFEEFFRSAITFFEEGSE
ncbi:MAG: hypothetical protein PHG66_00345 [Candidatus Colwellbacteria bacterium]|nr:hypothetical protein [Candidatus Colwellbacteria bacterium]